MGILKAINLFNRDAARRNIFVRPPEPPEDYLMGDPTDSIYIGRTDIFHVPYHWTFRNITNPHVAVVGITGSGKSISYDDPVLVRVNGTERLVKIGEFIDQLIGANSNRVERIGECDGIGNPDIEVYSFNQKLKGEWTKVTFAARKKSPEKLYKFTTASGREVTVTEDHNLVILKDSRVKFVKGSEVGAGSYVPLARKIHSSSVTSKLNLLELLTNARRLNVLGMEELIRKSRSSLSSANLDPNFSKYLRFYAKGRPVPISFASKILKFLKFEHDEAVLSKLRVRSINGYSSLPALLDLSHELARLIGYIISEGTIGEQAVYISNIESQFLEDAKRCARALNLNAFDVKGGLRIGSRVFMALCNAIGLNEKSGNKKIPDQIITAENGIIAQFLKAYFEGDGGIDKNTASATTKSKSLANQLAYVLLKFGLVARVHPMFKKASNSSHKGDYYWRISISGKESLSIFAYYIGFISGRKNDLLHGLVSNESKPNTNVDIIPEIGSVIKNLYSQGIIARDQMLYSIGAGLRSPSRTNMQKICSSIDSRKIISAGQLQIFHDAEFLELLATSDLFWDRITSVQEIEAEHEYVYDMQVDNQVFLAGLGGIFVHNSYFVKTFITRASLIWGTNAFIIDWAGEYKDWVRQAGGKVLALGKGSYVNLLDTAGMRPNDRVKQIVRTLEILTEIGQYPEQKRLTELAIEQAYANAGFKMSEKVQRDEVGNILKSPTLRDVVHILEEKLQAGTYEFPAELENAIYRLKKFTKEGEDYFAQQSTINLEELTRIGLVDLDLSGLPDEIFRGLAALSMLQFIKEKMREEGWSPVKGLKLFVILDEAWKVAKDDNSDAVMIVREGRKYQFGLIVASQNPTDISEAIFSNVGTTFILRVKFERFLDYLQTTLNFSNYMKEKIRRFGVGQAAVNTAYQTAAQFSETFILEKIEGEEPLREYFLDIESILTEEQLRDETMAKTYSFERNELKKKLRSYGLDEVHVEEVATLFDKKNRHMDVISYVILLEKYGLLRNNTIAFLKEIGIDDATIINIFNKADFKKLGLADKDIIEVILSE